jgi:kynurenine formamidase
MDQLLELVTKARVFDLAQPYYVGMPHHPTHPPFLFGLVKQHGEYVSSIGGSSAADALALGSHVGTHIDALSHFSCNGKLHGGEPTLGNQSYSSGLRKHSIEMVAPILRRGVLLDIAGLRRLAVLPQEFEIEPAHLEEAVRMQNVEIRPGDVVLLRTGLARHWEDAARFISEVHGPGPGIAGARWLSDRGIFAAGSDTVAFELVPAPAMPVHVHLLVERGIHIIECLNLEEMASAHIYEFFFVAAPLKIRGATGSPIRPLAIVP